MTINIETAINNMNTLKSKGIKYSMTGSRTGADGTGDCSGTIYDSLRKAGASDAGWVLNTDSMHDWLIKNGFKLIATSKTWSMKRGDIVILGKKGQSGGAAGHVFMAVDGTNAIHCTWKSASANGVYVDNENTMPYSMGWYVYRLENTGGNNNGNTNSDWKKESATFVPNTSINLRESASANGKLIATIPVGQAIKYDQYMIDKNGYVWIRQPRGNNKFGYMATGESKNGKRVNYWGTFK